MTDPVRDAVINHSDNPFRPRLIGLVFICLALRAITPAGYMPAPIEQGGPFVLCPGGLSGAGLILAAQAHLAGEHGGHHGHDSVYDTPAGEFCPFGAVFGSAAVVTDLQHLSPENGQILVSTGPRFVARVTASHPFRARAPPSPTSRPV